jgi:hypothetical protein
MIVGAPLAAGDLAPTSTRAVIAVAACSVGRHR